MRTVTYSIRTVNYGEDHGEVYEVFAHETRHTTTGEEHRDALILCTSDHDEAKQVLSSLAVVDDEEG